MHAKTLQISAIALCMIFLSCRKEEPQHSAITHPAEDAIAGRYIVVLKDDAVGKVLDAGPRISYEGRQMRMREQGKTLFERNNIRQSGVYQTYVSALKGFAIEMTATEAAKLKLDPAVMAVEPDRLLSLPKTVIRKALAAPLVNTQVVPWGVRMVGGPGNGTGKIAWIIDSGIDYTHPDLLVSQLRSKSFLPTSNTGNDGNGHGTHVAGIIAAKNNTSGVVGVAAGAIVVSCRVLDSNGDGQFAYTLAAFDYVAEKANPGDVVNCSVTPKNAYTSVALDNAVKRVAARGIKVCLAAGNNGDNTLNYSPARVISPNVYVISAVDSNRIFASFSNYGASVNYAEPGVEIFSTYKKGTYATLSGTSMAAPHAAGILLLGPMRSEQTSLFDWDDTEDPIGIR